VGNDNTTRKAKLFGVAADPDWKKLQTMITHLDVPMCSERVQLIRGLRVLCILLLVLFWQLVAPASLLTTIIPVLALTDRSVRPRAATCDD